MKNMKKNFSDGELIRLGWKHSIKNLGFFIVAGIVSGVSIVLVYVLTAVLANEWIFMMYVGVLLILLMISIITVGMIKISLNIVDGKEVSIKDLFIHWNRVLLFLGVKIVYAVIVIVGFLLFIIPGYIWMLKYQLASFYVIDKGMGVMEAFKASAEATAGMRWDILGFSILIKIIIYLGFLAFGVGIFIAGPLSLIAYAAMYRILDGKKVKIS